jgi:hypothetical protein
MWRRGADSDGYVANFVETEQIMQFNGISASFLQVIFYTFVYMNLSCYVLVVYFHPFFIQVSIQI